MKKAIKNILAVIGAFAFIGGIITIVLASQTTMIKVNR